MKAKTRRERFEDVAGKRVQMVLERLEGLSKCANKRNYEYTPQDVEKMFRAIGERTRHAKKLFETEIDGPGKKKLFRF